MSDDSDMLIRRAGGEWAAPEQATYPRERDLQDILASEPHWLPGVSSDAVTVCELYTTAGPADICVVDVTGQLTVVECKLAMNSEPRRMVIGQVIDYAAAIWRDGPEGFLRAWRAANGQSLHELLSEDAFAQFETNLQEGRFGLCLAVDTIDADIQRLVEYLSRITLPEVAVTAVQLSYVRDGDVEILTPSTYGGELANEKATQRRSEQWTRESFLAAIVDESDRATATWLLDRTENASPMRGVHDPISYGSRPGGGVFLNPYGYDYGPAQLWINKSGQLMTYGHWNQFGAVKGHPGFRRLAELLGQPAMETQHGVPVAPLDREELWEVLLETTEAVNSPIGTEPIIDD